MAGLFQRLLLARNENSQNTGAPTILYPRVLVITADVRFYADVLSGVNSRVWQVDWARSLESAVAICRMGTTPLAIYDEQLPRTDWREAFRVFSTIPDHPKLVLAASREIDEALWRSVLFHGGYDVLSRNAHSSELKRVLRFAWLSVCEASHVAA
jgi:DNA-binding response OmpR family regulator